MMRGLSKISIVLLLSGLAFLVILYFQRDGVLREKYHEEFKSDARKLSAGIVAARNLRSEVLSTIAQFFSSSLNVNKWEFHNFTNNMLSKLNISSICYFGEDGTTYKTLNSRRDNCGKYQSKNSSGFDKDTSNVYIFQDVSSVDGTKGRALMVFKFNSLIPRDLMEGGLSGIRINLRTSQSDLDSGMMNYFNEEVFIVDGNQNYYIEVTKPVSFSSLTLSFDYILILTLFAALFGLVIYNVESALKREKLISLKVKKQKRAIERQYDEIATQKKIASQNERLASIGVLAAGIGHEINNPLSIIIGQLGKLKELVNRQTDVGERLLKVDKSVKRIERIVSALRKFSRQSRDDADESEKLFNVSALCIDTVSMLKELYEKDGIKVLLSLSIDEDLYIKGDRGKFQQVLINLISNARDAVENRKNALIKVIVKSDSENIAVSVLDNGAGITKEDQERIFDLFYTTKDVGRGTGIGLSLTREFVQDIFHGKINVSSEIGKGTEFQVVVPAYMDESKKEEIKQEMMNQSVEVKAKEIKCVKCNALVVDDEEGIRELLQEMLMDLGINTKTAEDGKVALEMYLDDPKEFDIIISDLKMPNMNGPQLLREIRSHKNLNQPKFILTSGCVNLNFEGSDKDVYEYVNGFIYKPFTEEQLIEKINEVLSNQELKSAA
ncbi:hybrid sensor histidine kinase/response regulator [Halobacteriovorax vibrionivorans]|uniref:histidine kinase n=1 Tax=Halobacteriovorax vibrionivorans TaxID=2152716 RepID=A0ABY0IJ27_9BACT|nr:hybrid sensor histidine kinase/response regulator [Halobacteriovorax vibrionivorans]TGD47905.1 hybrid sensor histidine kinase/response regulator [Halobacteriovorax sp. Y22]